MVKPLVLCSERIDRRAAHRGPILTGVAVLVLGVLGGLTGIAPARAAPPPGSEWTLTFSDEFDAPEVDQDKWEFWLEGQVRHAAVNLASNSFIEDGSLVVRITTTDGQLTAGGVQSRAGYGYGYFEVRAAVLGGWAGFWMQSPAMNDGVGDPAFYGTEMDVAEACCPGRVHHAVHWDGYEADHKQSDASISSEVVADQAEFNTYGLEWKPGVYNFWVNDHLSWSFTTAISERDDEWLRLTQETNGDSCGGECRYVIDYVRVYRDDGQVSGSGGSGASGGTSSVGGGAGAGEPEPEPGAGGDGTTPGSGGSGATGAGGVEPGGGASAGSAGTSSVAPANEASDEGCGCSLPRSTTNLSAWAALSALSLLLIRRRLSR